VKGTEAGLSGTMMFVAHADQRFCLAVRRRFGQAGYNAITVSSGRELLEAVRHWQPVLVVLSVELLDLGGLDLISRVRAMTRAAIFALGPPAGALNRGEVLAAGANAWFAEPAAGSELVATARLFLQQDPEPGEAAVADFVLGPLRLSRVTHTGSFRDQPIVLAEREFAVLLALAMCNGEALSHDMLQRKAFGHADISTRQDLRQLIYHLRGKLEPVPAQPRYLTSVRGFGYRLSIMPEAKPGGAARRGK
jgi:two-component system KDP operon response regulator KdpE